MLALRTSPPVFTIAEAERVALETYGLAAAVRPLPGERDCNFHLRTADRHEYVLKFVDAAASPETTDCQLRVLSHLAEQDPALPVPEIIPTTQGEEIGKVAGNGGTCSTCLMGYLPGRLLSDLAPDSTLLRNLGDMLARVDRALAGFFHPALGQRLAWDVRRLPELTEYTPYLGSDALRRCVERVGASLEKRMPALKGLRGQAIHGDCHGHNLLVDADDRSISGILDFGDMIHAPRVMEPAVAMSELLILDLVPLAKIGAVLEGYALRQRLEGEEVEVIYDLIAARHAITLLVHAWRVRHDAGGARILELSAGHAARSLEAMAGAGRETLTRSWHGAAGTRVVQGVGSTLDAEIDLARRHRLMGSGAELFYERPLHIVRGSGVWLYDREGRSYLDVYNNVPHVGHTHPTVVRAIQDQTAILATHTRYLHARILEYAERLTATLPGHLNACMFVNSGSEANDVAWRIAKSSTGHTGGLVMQHAYHGITDAVAALTPGVGESKDPRVVTLRPPSRDLELRPEPGSNPAAVAAALAAAAADADQAIRTLAERGLEPAAFFIDTALTSSGIFDPQPGWAGAVSARVRVAGGLVVADEVQYGLGRCGSHLWGFARRGFEPDIVTLGKPVGNGYPMGVVIANRALIEAFQERYGFFSTFGGNAVAAAAGIAVLEVLEREELMANAHGTGEYLRAGLAALAARHRCLGAVRGSGLLLGLEVKPAAGHTARQCAKRIINSLASQARILIGYEGPEASVLKLRPPMPFRAEHADRLIEAIGAAAAAIDARESLN